MVYHFRTRLTERDHLFKLKSKNGDGIPKGNI